MIRTILIDDEGHCLKTLSHSLERYCPEVQIIEKCRSAKSGLEAIRLHHPSLIFLDIEMPVMNGFEMLEQFQSIPFAVIFTTGYDQYAIKAFKYSALDYLLKPVEPNELIAAIEKVKVGKPLPSSEQFDILLKQMNNRGHGFEKIAVPTAEGYELIRTDNIIRCEADDNYTRLFLKDNVRIVACRSLKEVEDLLENFPFFLRVHHSFLVNMNEVTKYIRSDGGYLVMSDGADVTISRSRKDALIKWFT
jgi:two-component system LytT family response regulator